MAPCQAQTCCCGLALQDARLCVWDVQMVPSEGEVLATPVAGTGMRKSASMQKLEMGRKASGDLLLMVQQQVRVSAALMRLGAL